MTCHQLRKGQPNEISYLQCLNVKGQWHQLAYIEIYVLIDSLLDVYIFLHVVGNRDILNIFGH